MTRNNVSTQKQTPTRTYVSYISFLRKKSEKIKSHDDEINEIGAQAI